MIYLLLLIVGLTAHHFRQAHKDYRRRMKFKKRCALAIIKLTKECERFAKACSGTITVIVTIENWIRSINFIEQYPLTIDAERRVRAKQ